MTTPTLKLITIQPSAFVDQMVVVDQTAIASVEVHMVDATYRTIDEEAAKP
jgi:hypothetical protein